MKTAQRSNPIGVQDFVSLDEIRDVEAEQELLGACLCHRSAVDSVAMLTDEADFFDPKHVLIRRAIGLMAADKDCPADPVACKRYLGRDLEAAGGMLYLGTILCERKCLSGSVPWFCERVRTLAGKRAAVTDVLATLRTKGLSMEEIAAGVAQAMDKCRVDAPTVSAGAIATQTERELRTARDTGDYRRGVPSPWPRLDSLTGGIRCGDTTIIAARPSVGKSAVGLSWAIHAAASGWRVLFASLEMSQEQVGDRMIAQIAGIEASRLRSAHVSAGDMERVIEARDYLAGLPFDVVVKRGVRCRDLHGLARSLPRQHGLLVVDYVQLVVPEDKRIAREQQVAEISKAIKNTALDCQVAVIVIAQLNRPAKGGAKNPEPHLPDLRESGALENDADNVLMLHRQDYGSANPGPTSALTMFLRKQRNGPVGSVELRFERATQRIFEGV